MGVSGLVILSYLAFSAIGLLAEFLNMRRLKGRGRLPAKGLEEEFDSGFFYKASEYHGEYARLRIVSGVFGDAVVLLFVFGGALTAYDSFISSLGLPFVLSGVIFVLGLVYLAHFLTLPFSLWSVFGIEKRHGFGNMTPALFLMDSIKGLLVSSVLISALAAGALYIVERSPALWWLWAWAFFTAWSLFMVYISPLVIEPLFNKFEPLKDEQFASGIREVAEKAGIRLEKALKMDASRRSTHTNAYFTGLGRQKRIVLYDTLLKRLGPEEIKSVAAHEAGHWRLRHITKRLILSSSLSLAVLYCSYLALGLRLPAVLLSYEGGSFFANATLLAFLWGIASFPAKPLLLYLSRRDETEADSFASRITGGGDAMAYAIKKLSLDNLSNLFPHPLYVALHYSHPPALDRIRRLKGG